MIAVALKPTTRAKTKGNNTSRAKLAHTAIAASMTRVEIRRLRTSRPSEPTLFVASILRACVAILNTGIKPAAPTTAPMMTASTIDTPWLPSFSFCRFLPQTRFVLKPDL